MYIFVLSDMHKKYSNFSRTQTIFKFLIKITNMQQKIFTMRLVLSLIKDIGAKVEIKSEQRQLSHK